MCNCPKEVKIGTYENQLVLAAPEFMLPLLTMLGKEKKPFISVDKCLVEEVMELWRLKIYTLGVCCGHHKQEGYIQVKDKYIPIMEEMGYEHVKEDKNAPKNAFIPKTKYK